MREIASLEIHRLVIELKDVENRFIKKFYELSEGDFRVSLSDGTSLYISLSGTINRTRYLEDTEMTNFASAVRKRVDNQRITGIRQLGSDRVFEISLGNGLKIIVEMFNRGNLMILDAENRIGIAYKYLKQREREIAKGVAYETDRAKAVWEMSKEEIAARIRSAIEAGLEEPLVRTLVKALEIGPTYVEELVRRCGLEPRAGCGSASGREEELATALMKLVKESEVGEAILYEAGGKAIDYSIVELGKYAGMEKKTYPKLGELMDERYAGLRNERVHGEGAAGSIRELEISIGKQKALADALEAEEEKERGAANYIFEHMQEMNEIINYLMQNKKATAQEISEKFGIKVKRVDLKAKKIVFEV